MAVLDVLVAGLAKLVLGDPIDPDREFNQDAQGVPLATDERDPDPDPVELVDKRTRDAVDRFRVELSELIQRPTLIREEQADNWQVTKLTLPGGAARRLAEANPHRMLLELNRIPALSDAEFDASLDVTVRVGPSQAAVLSDKTSTVIASSWPTNVAADVWAWSDTAIDVEVIEYFRSGLAPGYLRTFGGR